MKKTNRTGTDEQSEKYRETGKLYIVATPIGNSRDLSPRAIEILKDVDIIACEDTRRSMVLLNMLGIHNKLVSNHKFNEHGKQSYFIQELKAGKNIAVITDAGTPCISDPGNELIKAAANEKICIVSIPGCCAAVTALAISGFDLSTFSFDGFFPRENSERRKLIRTLRRYPTYMTHVFYESPLRIMDTIEFLISYEVDCQLCVCNDLTKHHERVYRGSPKEVREKLLEKATYNKGEYVLILEWTNEYLITGVKHPMVPEAALVETMIKHNCSYREAMLLLLRDETNQYRKNELYSAVLHLKDLFSVDG